MTARRMAVMATRQMQSKSPSRDFSSFTAYNLQNVCSSQETGICSEKKFKRLKTLLGRVYRDISRKLEQRADVQFLNIENLNSSSKCNYSELA